MVYYAIVMEKFLLKLQDSYRKFKVYGQKTGDSGREKERKSTKKNSASKSVADSKNSADRFYDMWEIRRNNALFKEMCLECGLPAPKWYYMKENIDPEILSSIHYPVVVKPVEMCEDAYIFICHTEEELLEGYNQAIGYSQSRQVVVEEYVNGVVFASSVYVNNGEAYSHYEHVSAYNEALQKMVEKIHMQNGKFLLHGIKNEEGSFFISFELREWGKHSA